MEYVINNLGKVKKVMTFDPLLMYTYNQGLLQG
jgi:hypothetical protein